MTKQITTFDRLKDYKVRQELVTRCYCCWIEKYYKINYKVHRRLYCVPRWITKWNGKTKCDGRTLSYRTYLERLSSLSKSLVCFELRPLKIIRVLIPYLSVWKFSLVFIGSLCQNFIIMKKISKVQNRKYAHNWKFNGLCGWGKNSKAIFQITNFFKIYH